MINNVVTALKEKLSKNLVFENNSGYMRKIEEMNEVNESTEIIKN